MAWLRRRYFTWKGISTNACVCQERARFCPITNGSDLGLRPLSIVVLVPKRVFRYGRAKRELNDTLLPIGAVHYILTRRENLDCLF